MLAKSSTQLHNISVPRVILGRLVRYSQNVECYIFERDVDDDDDDYDYDYGCHLVQANWVFPSSNRFLRSKYCYVIQNLS
ncbi:hypothetical protein M0802_010300 [Mischocyttarus mexicanus]|nr:hypothetical protein M0802_010300 [Mischocyttarus mexicanus]